MAGAALSALLLEAVWLTSFDLSGTCINNVVSEIPSPTNGHRAVVFQRNCGATTGISVQMSILEPSEPISNEAGNTLILEGQREVVPKWVGEKSLKVEYQKSPYVFLAVPEMLGASLTYVVVTDKTSSPEN